jgi:hypothetical protein
MDFIKKHLMLILGAIAVISILGLALYVHARIKAIRSKKQETTLAKEPLLNAESTKREYDVANAGAAEIFFNKEKAVAQSSSASEHEAAGSPAAPALPYTSSDTASSGREAVRKNTKEGELKKRASAATASAATGIGTETRAGATTSPVAPVSNATAGATESVASAGTGGGGALEEMERREQAAAAAARKEANARIEAERKAREEAERKAAELEAANSKPRFNFTIVEERNDFAKINFPDKQKRNEEKEALYAAKIYGTQRVKSGDPLTLRNMEEIPYGNNRIPVSSIMYGIANQVGNRMHIAITSVITKSGKFPLTALTICDHDMVKGIYLKDYEDVAQDNASESVIDEVGTALPNQLIGSVAKTTTKQIQKNVTKQQKISIILEDEYEVFIAVPLKK